MRRKLFISVILLVTLGMLAILPILINQKVSEEPVVVFPLDEPVEVSFEYGIRTDSLSIEKGIVRKNQSLSDILSIYNISSDLIHRIAILSRPVFDVRKIRTGNPYAVFLSKDSIPEPLYFVYEEDRVSYITYDLKGINVTKGARPLVTDTAFTAGIIESSLWNSLVNERADPNLANEMSEVYAWTIDFFGIQRGDYYKVIYEELSVEGRTIGTGKVLAACFHHGGKDLYAFRFEKKGEVGYYDEKGENLQRAFLKAPLRFRRISSTFSNSRLHPVLKIRRPHHGVDYAADYGTPVQSVGEGTIIAKGWDPKGGGNYLKIRHNSTYTTVYMHLQGFAKGIREGARVSQGDIIGYVGSTGLATGPHLDFRVYRNGYAIDPLKMESPPAEPVAKEYLTEYYQIRDSFRSGLDTSLVVDFSDPRQ